MKMNEKSQRRLLAFLQNLNVVRIRDQKEWNRFVSFMIGCGLDDLLPHGFCRNAARGEIIEASKSDPHRPLRGEDWDGETLYAECQIGKGSIGIHPYTVKATVEWYGAEPLSVDDIGA